MADWRVVISVSDNQVTDILQPDILIT